MRKILMIARREYLQAIKRKGFWIGTLAFPLLMGLLFVVPIGLSLINPENQKTIVFLDETRALVEPVRRALVENTLKSGEPEYVIEEGRLDDGLEAAREAYEQAVWSGEIYGVLTIEDALDSDESFRFYRKNVGDQQTSSTVRRALRDAVVDLRLARSDLAVDKAELERLTDPVQLESFQVSESGGSKKKGFLASYFSTYVFVMMLYFMLYFYGFAVTRGVLEEKSRRVMEMILGSVSPEQLMTGKILGIGSVGLTQMAIYMVTVGALRIGIIAFVHAEEAGAVIDAISPDKLLFFLLYFVLGYFLFVTLFAIIGAACNTEQEAQNFQMPVVMALLIPMMSTIFFVQHPDAPAAVVLSLIPLFTPMLMFMRIAVLTPPAWQILLSIVLMLGAIWIMFRFAARIFRVGTLMYGKRPTIGEIMRWARQSAD